MSKCITCYFDNRGSCIYMFGVEQQAIKVPLVDSKYNKHLPKCSMFCTGDRVYQIRTPVRILNENEHYTGFIQLFIRSWLWIDSKGLYMHNPSDIYLEEIFTKEMTIIKNDICVEPGTYAVHKDNIVLMIIEVRNPVQHISVSMSSARPE